MDGFDTNFDQFRINTLAGHFIEELKDARTKMEIDWLRSLLHAAMRVKSEDDGKKFGNMIEFCITVPTDRFLEIRERWRGMTISSGGNIQIFSEDRNQELALLCRERLEVLTEFRTDKSLDPMARLHEVLKERYPGIPITLAFGFNGNPIRISTFSFTFSGTLFGGHGIYFFIWQRSFQLMIACAAQRNR